MNTNSNLTTVIVPPDMNAIRAKLMERLSVDGLPFQGRLQTIATDGTNVVIGFTEDGHILDTQVDEQLVQASLLFDFFRQEDGSVVAMLPINADDAHKTLVGQILAAMNTEVFQVARETLMRRFDGDTVSTQLVKYTFAKNGEVDVISQIVIGGKIAFAGLITEGGDKFAMTQDGIFDANDRKVGSFEGIPGTPVSLIEGDTGSLKVYFRVKNGNYLPYTFNLETGDYKKGDTGYLTPALCTRNGQPVWLTPRSDATAPYGWGTVTATA